MKTTKMKRKLALFVAVIMTLSLWTAAPLQASADADTVTVGTTGDFRYVVLNGSGRIVAYTGNAATISIPSTVGDNIPVKIISHGAFAACASLETVTIPDSVTNIASYAFYGCTSLSTINVPSDLVVVDENAFYNCTSLTDSSLPDIIKDTFGSDTSISVGTSGNYRYTVTLNGSEEKATIWSYKGSGTQVTIPSIMAGISLTEVGAGTFAGCVSLGAITIPAGITTLGNYAFASTGLRSVTIPADVTDIGGQVFRNCTSLETVEILGAVNTMHYGPFYGCTSLNNVTITGAVELIGEYAFHGCSALQSITIPVSVESIGQYAFREAGLTSITIPSSVTSIGINAFRDCAELATVAINGAATIGADAFRNNPKLTSVAMPNVTAIGAFAFYRCSALQSIAIPASVTSIGDDAFRETGLTSVTIPSTVTSLGNTIFQNCTALATAVIADGRTLLGGTIFDGCTSLVSVSIPDSVTTIYGAFNGCTALTSITTKATSISAAAFTGCTALTAINVNGDNSAYQTIDGVLFNKAGTTLVRYPAGKADTYLVPSSVTTIGDGAFRGDTTLTSVTLPSSITDIKARAFEGCTVLGDVIILKTNVWGCDTTAFSGCDFDKLKLWIYSANTTIPTYVVGKGKDGGNINYGYLLNHLTVDETLALNTGASDTLSTEYFATARDSGKSEDDEAMDAKVETPDVTWSITEDDPEGDNNDPVVEVDEATGKITDLQPGTAKVTASVTSLAGGDPITDTCDVTVTTLTASITSFTLEGVKADIHYGDTNTITVELPAGTNLTSLAPTIEHNGTSVIPGSGIAKDFTSDVVYMVNSGAAYIVTVTLSPVITEFKIGNAVGIIDNDAETIDVTVPYGTDVTSLTPAITTNSTNAEPISPTGGQSFANPVDYTVTAANGSTKTYTVTVTVAPPPAPPTPTTYAVTVTGGTGSGSFEEGDTVTITANAPVDGKVFGKWTSDEVTFASATSATTTFIMPAKAVTVMANYKDDPNTGGDDTYDPPVTDGWVYEDGVWTYLAGGEIATGWIRDDGAWYYLAATGVMETGWVYDQSDKTWYYLAGNGAMKTGWVKDNGSWYYLAGNGAMVASKWFKDTDGSWYYLSGNGKMLTGKQTIGGKVYSFKSNGVWIS